MEKDQFVIERAVEAILKETRGKAGTDVEGLSFLMRAACSYQWKQMHRFRAMHEQESNSDKTSRADGPGPKERGHQARRREL